MGENKIKLFIENSVKGYEDRKKLFDEISKELYEILYTNAPYEYSLDILVDEYMNLASFFADDFYSFKILTFFALKERSDFEKSQIYQKLSLGILSDMDKWMGVVRDSFNKLSSEEIHLMYRLQ